MDFWYAKLKDYFKIPCLLWHPFLLTPDFTSNLRTWERGTLHKCTWILHSKRAKKIPKLSFWRKKVATKRCQQMKSVDFLYERGIKEGGAKKSLVSFFFHWSSPHLKEGRWDRVRRSCLLSSSSLQQYMYSMQQQTHTYTHLQWPELRVKVTAEDTIELEAPVPGGPPRSFACCRRFHPPPPVPRESRALFHLSEFCQNSRNAFYKNRRPTWQFRNEIFYPSCCHY